jgi:phenylpropionate dioxygenase-like ring-hydroxylating dioxygenase large terminal subunit
MATSKRGPARLEVVESKSLAWKVRHVGMNPNHWYPAEWDAAVPRKRVVETTFWGQSIALYRGEDGEVAAVENRCPHRQIKLSHGSVEGCNLVCLYHGWTFNRDGELVGMKHDRFGKRLPKVGVRTYPVRVRYGVVWIFPGDPRLAEVTPLVEIPNGDGPERWAHLAFDYTWRAHHSMVIDNLCNLTHLWVHGSWVPYGDTVLADSSAEGERLTLHWRSDLRRDWMHPFTKLFFREAPDSNMSDTFMVYDYPYQSALSNGRVRSTNFMLPIDETTTRVFTIQFWAGLPIPGLMKMNHRLTRLGLPLLKPVTEEIFRQDGFTVEEEQKSFELHYDKPIPEPNPMVKRFNDITVRKWDEWLALESSGRLSAAAKKAAARRKIL